MLVVNYNGRLIHVISEDNKQKYRIPIYGVTTRSIECYQDILSLDITKNKMVVQIKLKTK